MSVREAVACNVLLSQGVWGVEQTAQQRRNAVDIIDVLKKEHEEVSELLDQVCETTEAVVKTRGEIFPQILRMLKAHAEAEEKAVYLVLENEDEVRDIILESFEEHKVVIQLLDSLEDMD